MPGTKIVYEKAFLMNLRSSPISRTPPSYEIPEVLQKGSPNKTPDRKPKIRSTPKRNQTKENDSKDNFQDEEQFQLDM